MTHPPSDASLAWAALVPGAEAIRTSAGQEAIRVDGIVCTRRAGDVVVHTPGRDVFAKLACKGRGWEKRAAAFVVKQVPMVPRGSRK